jgi:hypothetical protein
MVTGNFFDFFSTDFTSADGVGRGISRFPRKELPHILVSSTTPGRLGARDIAPIRVAFR